jgi:integrase/recombinase XerD
MKHMYNIENEIIKKKYEQSLELDEKLSSKSIYSKIKDIRKFEEFIGFKDLTNLNKDQALKFKEHLKKKVNASENGLQYATVWRVLDNIKSFFFWLGNEKQYKKKINLNELNAFNLSMKEESMAKVRGFKNIPTLEQLYKTVSLMPNNLEIEKRDKAIFALTVATGIRVSALISLKLCHIDEYKGLVKQDPRTMDTKFSKPILTQFFPVKEEVQQIVIEWVKFLKEEKSFGQSDPLFPAIQNEFDDVNQIFKAENLSKKHIKSTTTVRDIFKQAFGNAKIEYYNPHSFRDTLVQLGEKICKNPEEFKAWSQNLGHSSPLTTFTSYGAVHSSRQCDIIQNLARGNI